MKSMYGLTGSVCHTMFARAGGLHGCQTHPAEVPTFHPKFVQ